MTLRQRPGCKSLWFVFIRKGRQQRHIEGNGKYAEHEKRTPSLIRHTCKQEPIREKKQQTKQRNKRKEKKEMANFITKNIPNTITCCNLISGCIATSFAFVNRPELALLWIIIGAVFDFFDGMSARLLGVSSPIGKELDSLADDITFGVAPATMVFAELAVMDYPATLEPLRQYLPYFAYIMAAFSALRLAKFNLDTRQTTSFIGLPTPANALFWGSLIVGARDLLEASPYNVFIVMAMVLLTSYILIAEIPMFALKFKNWGWKGNEVKYIFIITCIPLIAFFLLSAFAIIIAWYVILSVCVNKTAKKTAPANDQKA